MEIKLVPDSSIASAPAGLTAAVQAAANVFDEDFPGDYTINVSYGWGTFDNEPYGPLTDPNSGDFSVGGPVNGEYASYSQLKGWLTAHATSSDQKTAVASLPANNTAFPGGADTFYVSSAEEKALGVFTGSSSAIDGSIGFNVGDTSNSYYWETGALVEIAHALGWDTAYYMGGVPSIADLFRYSSPGNYQWTGGQPAYFSFNGGDTALAHFSPSFDYTLFSDVAADDPFNVNGDTDPARALTSLDIEVLDVIGFSMTSTVSVSVNNTKTPTVSVSVNNTDLTLAHDTATVMFAFSEAPTKFSLSDAKAVGGTLSALKEVNATTYTATFTGAVNTDINDAVVRVTAGSWQDANGNPGAAGSTKAFTVDTMDHWIKSINAAWGTAADWGNGVPNASVGADVDTNGTYEVSIASAAAAYGLTLNDAGATVADNSGGTLTLDGTGGSSSPNGVLRINAGAFALNGGALHAGSLAIASSGHLSVSLGAYTGSNAISEAIVDNGTIVINDGSAVAIGGGINGTGSIVVESKASATFTGAVAGSETVTVENTAHAVFDTPIAGTGSFVVMNGGSLEFGAADSENVTFATGSTGTLKVDHSLTARFTGTIAGLTQHNMVDLADLTWVKGQMHATFSGNSAGGLLTVTDGSHSVELKLSGNYTTSRWALSHDGSGGTEIVDSLVSDSIAAHKVGHFGDATTSCLLA